MNEPKIASPTVAQPTGGHIDPKARLAELEKRKMDRQAKAESEKLEEDLEWAELRERFEAELGPQGVAFEMIDASPVNEGIFVVKLGEAVLHKRFEATQSKGKTTPEDFADFARPCIVHPSADAFNVAIGRRPEIVARCVAALLTLYGANRGDTRGKY